MAQKKYYNNKNNNNNQGGGNSNNNRSNNPPSNNPPPKPREQEPREGNENKPAAKPAKTTSDTSYDLLWFGAVLVVVAGLFLFNKYYLAPRRPGIYNSNYKSPLFRKEGGLVFMDGWENKKKISIDVEIADTPREQVLGLTNRRFLPANGGMLFVYTEAEPRTLTTESIFITLDILFINANKEIIRVYKNAPPLSEISIPSGGKVQYILQVQGGFCDAFNIRANDYIKADGGW